MKRLACRAPWNEGGLGRFLATLVEQARAGGELDTYYTTAAKPNDPCGCEVSLRRFRPFFHLPPLRFRYDWREFLANELFDRTVATRLTSRSSFTGFAGMAEHSFRRARALGSPQVVLESPTSHVANVRRQHARAAAAGAIEPSWLHHLHYNKTVREYAAADIVQVTSEYARQSFLAAGVSAEKVRRRVQPVGRRFTPPLTAHNSPGFQIVYVGRLQVSKGLLTLLEAFARLGDPTARLALVGGCATDSMERYLHRRLQGDPRITMQSGDPLPYLHRAHVLVHPSWEDGLGLAPLEALACGVPVIVTEDTGMKEYVVPGSNGFIVPTGDVDALVTQLAAVRARPLKGTFEAPTPCRPAVEPAGAPI